MSKQITYYPRSSFASDILNFVTDAGVVTLVKELPVIVTSEQFEQLSQDEEFKTCLEQNIIIEKDVKDATPPASIPLMTKSSEALGVTEQLAESIKPATTTAKTTKTTS